MGHFRKKPVVIEAVQYTRETADTCRLFVGDQLHPVQDAADMLLIATLEGTMAASLGDWVIRGVQGEFYPCKPDIFAATYEEVSA
jgi:hypothetical protein